MFSVPLPVIDPAWSNSKSFNACFVLFSLSFFFFADEGGQFRNKACFVIGRGKWCSRQEVEAFLNQVGRKSQDILSNIKSSMCTRQQPPTQLITGSGLDMPAVPSSSVLGCLLLYFDSDSFHQICFYFTMENICNFYTFFILFNLFFPHVCAWYLFNNTNITASCAITHGSKNQLDIKKN